MTSERWRVFPFTVATTGSELAALGCCVEPLWPACALLLGVVVLFWARAPVALSSSKRAPAASRWSEGVMSNSSLGDAWAHYGETERPAQGLQLCVCIKFVIVGARTIQLLQPSR